MIGTTLWLMEDRDGFDMVSEVLDQALLWGRGQVGKMWLGGLVIQPGFAIIWHIANVYSVCVWVFVWGKASSFGSLVSYFVAQYARVGLDFEQGGVPATDRALGQELGNLVGQLAMFGVLQSVGSDQGIVDYL